MTDSENSLSVWDKCQLICHDVGIRLGKGSVHHAIWLDKGYAEFSWHPPFQPIVTVKVTLEFVNDCTCLEAIAEFLAANMETC